MEKMDIAVRKLLDAFITPKYGDILDYKVNTHEYNGSHAVAINVIMKHRIIFRKEEEYEIERSIKKVMQYISPAFVMVEFYVTNDY
jgi:hypothetical protein